MTTNWLPLVTSRYVQVSGDRSVLDEPAGYLEGRVAVEPWRGILFRPATAQRTARNSISIAYAPSNMACNAVPTACR